MTQIRNVLAHKGNHVETIAPHEPLLAAVARMNQCRIGSVVVAALTRVSRGVVSELELTPDVDGVPTECVANFDNLHTLPRASFRRFVGRLGAARMAEACRVLRDATGC